MALEMMPPGMPGMLWLGFAAGRAEDAAVRRAAGCRGFG